MKITKLERSPDGVWTARVSGTPVTRVFGSWGTPPTADGYWHDIDPTIAARLQEKVRRIEKREKQCST